MRTDQPRKGSSNIIRHGFYKTRWGKRRRYQGRTCGKTFCSTTGTAYHRLQHPRATFDEVVVLSVEGLNKSARARVKRVGWNTVRSLAGKSGLLVPSFQCSKNKGPLRQGASGRRDSNDRWGQGTVDLDLCCHRRLLSALAFNGRRETEL